MDHHGSRNTFKRLVRGRGSDIKLGHSEGKPAAIILTRSIAAARALLFVCRVGIHGPRGAALRRRGASGEGVVLLYVVEAQPAGLDAPETSIWAHTCASRFSVVERGTPASTTVGVPCHVAPVAHVKSAVAFATAMATSSPCSPVEQALSAVQSTPALAAQFSARLMSIPFASRQYANADADAVGATANAHAS